MNPIKKLSQEQPQEQSKDETPNAEILVSLKRQPVRRKKASKREEITSKKTKEPKIQKKRVKNKNPLP